MDERLYDHNRPHQPLVGLILGYLSPRYDEMVLLSAVLSGTVGMARCYQDVFGLMSHSTASSDV